MTSEQDSSILQGYDSYRGSSSMFVLGFLWVVAAIFLVFQFGFHKDGFWWFLASTGIPGLVNLGCRWELKVSKEGFVLKRKFVFITYQIYHFSLDSTPILAEKEVVHYEKVHLGLQFEKDGVEVIFGPNGGAETLLGEILEERKKYSSSLLRRENNERSFNRS